ncbi:hypothetical protein KQX54_011512 [Cotesia glomerata]|uniref:Uncharacterized protein n=1 Tax=Cotesia glomerata TaxID=32391 RepID=A0AAV7HZL7_COTGL|nr:hypothetical protein KQX54_011512 [Cotesia glomerata]
MNDYSLGNFDSQSNDSEKKKNILFIMELESDKVWTKLQLPVIPADCDQKAREIFPQLLNTKFYFTDLDGARLDEILIDYVLSKPTGVTLKIKTVDSQPKTQTRD